MQFYLIIIKNNAGNWEYRMERNVGVISELYLSQHFIIFGSANV